MGATDARQRARTTMWAHPRGLLAVKTAVAAALAWVLVQPLGGFLEDYQYYAPLGAVVAMSTTVVSSVRTSWQAAAAVTLGALIALAVQPLPVATPVGIGIAVLLSTLAAGSPPLGSMGGWVPTASLFALVLGHQHPVQYVAAYGGLIALGAMVGVAVNLAVPQLPITPAALAAERLRAEVAAQLDDLADGLTAESRLSAQEWAARSRSLGSHSRRVDELVDVVREGQRVNWRSRRWAEAAQQQYRLADALVRLSDCVDDVADIVGDERATVHADDEVGAELRTALAEAMGAVAALLREADPGGEGDAVDRAVTAVRRARDRLERVPGESGPQLAAAAVTANLQRAVDVWS